MLFWSWLFQYRTITMCCDIGNIEHMNQNDDRSASDRGTNKAVWMLAWLFVNLITSAPNLSHCRLLVPLNARRLHYLIYTLFFVVVRTGLDVFWGKFSVRGNPRFLEVLLRILLQQPQHATQRFH